MFSFDDMPFDDEEDNIIDLPLNGPNIEAPGDLLLEEDRSPLVDPTGGELGEYEFDVGAPAMAPEYNEYDVNEVITAGIASSNVIEIEYTSIRSLDTKWYTVEPYEIGPHNSRPGGYFWAWDVNSNGIKSFFLSNISRARMTEHVFVPRF